MQESTQQLTDQSEAACPNCGAQLVGEYCFQCGQQRLPPDHLSMRHFVQEAIVHVGDFEHSKIFRTTRALLFRPGLLTNDYVAGRRAGWITPLKAFLVVFAMSVFLYSAFKSVAFYDVETLIESTPNGEPLRKMISGLAEKRQMAVDLFIATVNAKWRTYVGFSQLAYPVCFAVVLMAFYGRQRRYFVEHLVFSTHYQTFSLLIVVIAWPLYLLTGLALSRTSAILSIVMTAALIGYVIVAARKVYRQSWLVSSVKGVLLYVVYYIIYGVLTFGALLLALIAVMRAGK